MPISLSADTVVSAVAVPAGTATRIVAASPGRVLLAIANTGTAPAAIGTSNAVTATTGWPLAAAAAAGDQGGAYEWSETAVHGGELWAFSTAGTTIAVMQAVPVIVQG